MTVRLGGAEAVTAPPLPFPGGSEIPAFPFWQFLSRRLLCRNRFRQMAEPRSVKIHRLKINLSACRFENKVQFCNPEKTVLDARPASDYFSVYATTIGLSLSFEHSSRLLILGLRFFLYSSGICGEQVPKNVSP